MKLIILFLFQFLSSSYSYTNSEEINYIKLLNKTHFSCDENKILKMNQFNDDFCDCEDGSDENSKLLLIKKPTLAAMENSNV